jgi:hypothetical protein
MTPHRRFPVAAVAILLTALAAVPGRAADLDPYLPEDTETVINLNVRQILDSPLIKKHALEAAQEALRGNDHIQDILKDLGFDPFKDLDRVLIAAPGGTDKDRGLVIVRGRFDLDKFKAKAEETAKSDAEHLKIQKVLGGKYLLYEVNTPDLDTPLFVALAGKETVLVSPGKDYVIDALKKTGKTDKVALKNKDFQALLEKLDDRQSLSMAAIKTPAVRDAVNGLPGDVKDMVDKIQAVGGGVTISDEVRMEIVVTTKNTSDAKELRDSADAGLKLVLAGLSAFTTNQKNPQPGVDFLLEFAKSLRVSNKGQAVILKGRINSDFIEETLKKDK